MDKLLARSGLLDGIDVRAAVSVRSAQGSRSARKAAARQSACCSRAARRLYRTACPACSNRAMCSCAMALPSVPGCLHAPWCSARTVFVVCAALHAPITAGWSKILQV